MTRSNYRSLTNCYGKERFLTHNPNLSNQTVQNSSKENYSCGCSQNNSMNQQFINHENTQTQLQTQPQTQPQTYEQYQPQIQYQPQPQPQTPNNLSTSRHREQNSALQTNYMNSPMQASYCNLTNGGKKLAI